MKNPGTKYKRIETTGLYIDCSKLLERLYRLRFKIPKRDRAFFGDLILGFSLEMVSYLQDAFRDRVKRTEYIDLFLHTFAKLKVLLRCGSELKLFGVKDYTFIFEYVYKIDEGITKWRKSVVSSKQSTMDSNDDHGSNNIPNSRGDDGIIYSSSESAS